VSDCCLKPRQLFYHDEKKLQLHVDDVDDDDEDDAHFVLE